MVVFVVFAAISPAMAAFSKLELFDCHVIGLEVIEEKFEIEIMYTYWEVRVEIIKVLPNQHVCQSPEVCESWILKLQFSATCSL